MFVFVSLRGSEIDFVANKNNRYLVINLVDSGHPICSKSLNAIELVDIINQNDNIGLFDLTVCVLLILILGTCVDELCVYFVW